jgi:hypothetical protein
MQYAILLLALFGCPKEDDTEDTNDTDTGLTDTGDTEDTDPGLTCEDVAWTDGSSGTYTYDPAGDSDVKHHFDMPAGMTVLRAQVTWTRTEWDMALDAGLGGCPHSGTSYGSVDGEGGSLELEVTAESQSLATFEEGEMHFVHLKENMPVNPETGETTDYAMAAQVCRPAE